MPLPRYGHVLQQTYVRIFSIVVTVSGEHGQGATFTVDRRVNTWLTRKQHEGVNTVAHVASDVSGRLHAGGARAAWAIDGARARAGQQSAPCGRVSQSVYELQAHGFGPPLEMFWTTRTTGYRYVYICRCRIPTYTVDYHTISGTAVHLR